MKVKTKIGFKPYVKLLFSLAYERTVMKLLVGVAILLLLWIIFYYLHLFNLPKPIIYQYITLILIAVVEPTIIFITIWRNYKSSNHLGEALEMELTPKEIKITGESFYMEVEYEKMYKIVEKPKWFLFYQNTLSAIIIPKKDMRESDIIESREIFKDLIKVPTELE